MLVIGQFFTRSFVKIGDEGKFAQQEIQRLGGYLIAFGFLDGFAIGADQFFVVERRSDPWLI